MTERAKIKMYKRVESNKNAIAQFWAEKVCLAWWGDKNFDQLFYIFYQFEYEITLVYDTFWCIERGVAKILTFFIYFFLFDNEIKLVYVGLVYDTFWCPGV